MFSAIHLGGKTPPVEKENALAILTSQFYNKIDDSRCNYTIYVLSCCRFIDDPEVSIEGSAMIRGEKREKILRIAEKMFARRRFHEVTLDQIAMAAHVGKGTIYLYFQSKDDLLFQMVTSLLTELERRLNLVADSNAPVREKLCSFIDEMSSLFRKHHMSFRQFHGPELEQTNPGAGKFLRAHHCRLTELVRKILREGVRQGLIGTGVDLEVATCIFISVIHGHDMWFIETGKDISITAMVDLFLNGVKTPAARI